MALPKLIGIAGHRESGKDTAFLLVNELMPGAYERFAFADPLREELEPILLGKVPMPDDVPEPLREWIMEQVLLNDELEGMGLPPILFQKPYTERIRKIQQWWGTEYRRALYGDDYWFQKSEAHLGANPGKRFIFTDCRFPNEAKWVRAMRGVVWRIFNPRVDYKGDHHASERLIDEIVADVSIINYGTIELFKEKIATVLKYS